MKNDRYLWWLVAALWVISLAYSILVSAQTPPNAYVCSASSCAPGSFYDHPSGFTFKSAPTSTDLVCASDFPPGKWTQGGRPCNWMAFNLVKPAQTLGVCALVSGACLNQNGGVEGFAPLSAFATSPPPDPVPVTPSPTPSGGTGSLTVNWQRVTVGTKGEAVTVVGYCLYYGVNVGALTSQLCVGDVTTATIVNLAAGTYYGQMIAMTSTENSDRSSVWSAPVVATTPAPVPTPVPSLTVTPGVYTPKKGSSNVSGAPTFATLDTCHAYLGGLPPGTYNCVYSGEKVVVK